MYIVKLVDNTRDRRWVSAKNHQWIEEDVAELMPFFSATESRLLTS